VPFGPSASRSTRSDSQSGRNSGSEYIDGPFRHLENRWSFRDAEGGGCEVDFFITYEFKTPDHASFSARRRKRGGNAASAA
jgi:ribosome-associated toxin RatA of RatAB toxin-antitoxin module